MVEFNEVGGHHCLVGGLPSHSGYLSPATNGGAPVMVKCGHSGLFVLVPLFCIKYPYSSSYKIIFG